MHHEDNVLCFSNIEVDVFKTSIQNCIIKNWKTLPHLVWDILLGAGYTYVARCIYFEVGNVKQVPLDLL